MQRVLLILQRDLIGGAHRWWPWVLRCGWLMGLLLVATVVVGPEKNLGTAYWTITIFIYVVLALLAVGMASVTLAEEFRQGTLPLLFLAGMSPFHIVVGKYLSIVLRIGLLVLAGAPFFMMLMSFGTVTGGQVVATLLGWFLAAGWLSAIVMACSRPGRDAFMGLLWAVLPLMGVYAALLLSDYYLHTNLLAAMLFVLSVLFIPGTLSLSGQAGVWWAIFYFLIYLALILLALYFAVRSTRRGMREVFSATPSKCKSIGLRATRNFLARLRLSPVRHGVIHPWSCHIYTSLFLQWMGMPLLLTSSAFLACVYVVNLCDPDATIYDWRISILFTWFIFAAIISMKSAIVWRQLWRSGALEAFVLTTAQSWHLLGSYMTAVFWGSFPLLVTFFYFLLTTFFANKKTFGHAMLTEEIAVFVVFVYPWCFAQLFGLVAGLTFRSTLMCVISALLGLLIWESFVVYYGIILNFDVPYRLMIPVYWNLLLSTATVTSILLMICLAAIPGAVRRGR